LSRLSLCSLTIPLEVNSFAMAIDTSRFGKVLLEADGVDDETLSDEPFAGLDMRAAHCFGYRVPKERSWKFLAD